VQAAFLLIAAKPGRSLPPPASDLVRRRTPIGLPFEARAHLAWQDGAGGLALGCWHSAAPSLDVTPPWHVDDHGVAMCAGLVWWRGRPWIPGGDWARDLAARQRSGSLTDRLDDLRGVFAAVALGIDGSGIVLNDALGFRCLYYGETDDLVAVSSRAALTALALAPENTRPVRDAVSVGWLAYSGYTVGSGTGFEGVRVLPAGTHIELRPGEEPRTRTRAPWAPPAAWRDLQRDELVGEARADILDSLRSIMSMRAPRRLVGLTGGKDSRLILALLLAEGAADQFRYYTIGPPDLEDVRVATELAERFELRHSVEFPLGRPEDSYESRVRAFVAATAGQLNIWDLTSPGWPAEAELRLSGLGGEILRTYRRVRPELESTDDLVRFFDRRRWYGRLNLLHPEVEQRYRQRVLDELLHDPVGGLSPLDLLDVFFMSNRVRGSRLGAQEELTTELRALPLYSMDAVRAAFALGGRARQTELLHFEIIRSCSERLARHRFAGPGWSPELLDGLPDVVDSTSREAAPGGAPAAGTKPEPLMARIQRKGFADRQELLRATLTDPDNPAWELIDQIRALTALDQFGSLDQGSRRELYGAVTAALWLSGDGGP
jgi:hypothetical protein